MDRTNASSACFGACNSNVTFLRDHIFVLAIGIWTVPIALSFCKIDNWHACPAFIQKENVYFFPICCANHSSDWAIMLMILEALYTLPIPVGFSIWVSIVIADVKLTSKELTNTFLWIFPA